MSEHSHQSRSSLAPRRVGAMVLRYLVSAALVVDARWSI